MNIRTDKYRSTFNYHSHWQRRAHLKLTRENNTNRLCVLDLVCNASVGFDSAGNRATDLDVRGRWFKSHRWLPRYLLNTVEDGINFERHLRSRFIREVEIVMHNFSSVSTNHTTDKPGRRNGTARVGAQCLSTHENRLDRLSTKPTGQLYE